MWNLAAKLRERLTQSDRNVHVRNDQEQVAQRDDKEQTSSTLPLLNELLLHTRCLCPLSVGLSSASDMTAASLQMTCYGCHSKCTGALHTAGETVKNRLALVTILQEREGKRVRGREGKGKERE